MSRRRFPRPVAGLLLSTLAVTVAPLAAEGGSGSALDAVTPQQARRVFERFRALEGDWQSNSTKGWEGENEIRLLARGSVVASSTRFPDAPSHTMQTMIHLDGDRLLLTHYCEARNQPRLVLTEASEDGRSATFSFLDATNLPSRDHGHMDKAIYRFVDEDRFTSRWTWYADGQEDWMEEIAYRRVRR